MLVADVDVVSRILEADGFAPRCELGSRLLAGGVDVRGRASTRSNDLATLAKGGEENFLLPFDNLGR